MKDIPRIEKRHLLFYYLFQARRLEAPVKEPRHRVGRVLEQELHRALAALRRILELLRHLEEVELLRAHLGAHDAAAAQVRRAVVHDLRHLVPRVHDGVDHDVRLDDTGRLGRLGEQAEEVVLPVGGGHFVLVEERVDFRTVYLQG